MIDTDKYEGHTENKWEWYEFGDGDWILCPLFDGVKANEDDMWWVDENGEHINDSQDIFNWDERILDLSSDCVTGNNDPTRKDFVYCTRSSVRLPRKRADMHLIADAPLLLQALIDERAEVKQLREEQKQFHDLLAEVLPRKDGTPHMGVTLWGLESELKRVVSEIAIILGMAEREEE